MTTTTNKKLAPAVSFHEKHADLYLIWRVIKADPTARVALGILGFMVVIAVLAPVIAPYNPVEVNLPARFLPPSLSHPFGTDGFGRDILSRILYGARVSLAVGVIVVGISGAIGLVVGLTAGYYGKRVGEVLMRITDMFLAFPSLLLALAFAAALGPSLINAVIAITITRWSIYARLIRGTVLSEKEKEYVLSAKAIGKKNLGIMFNEILPNSINTLIVAATLDIGVVILIEAGLSFLGLGVQPPGAEWGAMVSDGTYYILTSWWMSTFPGLFIVVTVMAFNFLGDSLRDAIDPRIRTRL